MSFTREGDVPRTPSSGRASTKLTPRSPFCADIVREEIRLAAIDHEVFARVSLSLSPTLPEKETSVESICGELDLAPGQSSVGTWQEPTQVARNFARTASHSSHGRPPAGRPPSGRPTSGVRNFSPRIARDARGLPGGQGRAQPEVTAITSVTPGPVTGWDTSHTPFSPNQYILALAPKSRSPVRLNEVLSRRRNKPRTSQRATKQKQRDFTSIAPVAKACTLFANDAFLSGDTSQTEAMRQGQLQSCLAPHNLDGELLGSRQRNKAQSMGPTKHAELQGAEQQAHETSTPQYSSPFFMPTYLRASTASQTHRPGTGANYVFEVSKKESIMGAKNNPFDLLRIRRPSTMFQGITSPRDAPPLCHMPYLPFLNSSSLQPNPQRDPVLSARGYNDPAQSFVNNEGKMVQSGGGLLSTHIVNQRCNPEVEALEVPGINDDCHGEETLQNQQDSRNMGRVTQHASLMPKRHKSPIIERLARHNVAKADGVKDRPHTSHVFPESWHIHSPRNTSRDMRTINAGAPKPFQHTLAGVHDSRLNEETDELPSFSVCNGLPEFGGNGVMPLKGSSSRLQAYQLQDVVPHMSAQKIVIRQSTSVQKALEAVRAREAQMQSSLHEPLNAQFQEDHVTRPSSEGFRCSGSKTNINHFQFRQRGRFVRSKMSRRQDVDGLIQRENLFRKIAKQLLRDLQDTSVSGWTGTLDVELKEHLGAEAFEAIFGPLLHHVAQSARKSGYQATTVPEHKERVNPEAPSVHKNGGLSSDTIKKISFSTSWTDFVENVWPVSGPGGRTSCEQKGKAGSEECGPEGIGRLHRVKFTPKEDTSNVYTASGDFVSKKARMTSRPKPRRMEAVWLSPRPGKDLEGTNQTTRDFIELERPEKNEQLQVNIPEGRPEKRRPGVNELTGKEQDEEAAVLQEERIAGVYESVAEGGQGSPGCEQAMDETPLFVIAEMAEVFLDYSPLQRSIILRFSLELDGQLQDVFGRPVSMLTTP